MKLTYKILAVAVAISLCMVMAVPCFAVAREGVIDINIADYVSGKEYSGDQVVVTYDMPLNPFSEYFGVPAGGTEIDMELIQTSTDLYWTQNSDFDTVTTYTALADFGSFTKITGTSVLAKSVGIDPYSCTHVMMNGTIYALTIDVEYADTIIQWDIGDTTCHLVYQYDDDSFRFTGAAGTYDLSVGTYSEVTEEFYDYSQFFAYVWLLGVTDGYFGVVDISDIREGSNFDLTFTYDCVISNDGLPSDTTAKYSAYYLDENLNHVTSTSGDLTVNFNENMEQTISSTVTFTVPEGAAYFYLRFDTGIMDVKSCRMLDWDIENLTMSCMLAALEDQSETMQQVVDKLNAIDEKLDDVINGKPEDQQAAQDYIGTAGSQADNLDGLNDKLQNMEKPQLNAGNVSVDAYVDPSQMLTTMPFLTVLFESDIVVTMVMLVLTVGLCAYALFGKRG